MTRSTHQQRDDASLPGDDAVHGSKLRGLDRELEAAVDAFPREDLRDPVAARESLAKLAAAAPPVDTAGLTVEDRVVSGRGTQVPVRIYRPKEARGAIVWLRGGGFVMGDLETEHPWAVRIAKSSGAVVLSVDYRRAPEHPYPAALEDTYAVLGWAAQNSSLLGIDPMGIAIGGHGAGATLAAAAALRARDERGPALRFQLLNQPAFDDRQQTWSAQRFTDTPFMTRAKASASWRHYLGAMVNTSAVSPYAAPARASDLAGLPPAYIATAQFDPNRDEAIDYGLRMLRANVPVDLHQWAGTFHGSQAAVTATVSRRQIDELAAVLKHALA